MTELNIPYYNSKKKKKKDGDLTSLFSSSEESSESIWNKLFKRFKKTNFYKWLIKKIRYWCGLDGIENQSSSSENLYYELHKKIKPYLWIFKIIITILIIWFGFSLYHAIFPQRTIFYDSTGKQIHKAFGEIENEFLTEVYNYKEFIDSSKKHYKSIISSDFENGYIEVFINGFGNRNITFNKIKNDVIDLIPYDTDSSNCLCNVDIGLSIEVMALYDIRSVSHGHHEHLNRKIDILYSPQTYQMKSNANTLLKIKMKGENIEKDELCFDEYKVTFFNDIGNIETKVFKNFQANCICSCLSFVKYFISK